MRPEAARAILGAVMHQAQIAMPQRRQSLSGGRFPGGEPEVRANTFTNKGRYLGRENHAPDCVSEKAKRAVFQAPEAMSGHAGSPASAQYLSLQSTTYQYLRAALGLLKQAADQCLFNWGYKRFLPMARALAISFMSPPAQKCPCAAQYNSAVSLRIAAGAGQHLVNQLLRAMFRLSHYALSGRFRVNVRKHAVLLQPATGSWQSEGSCASSISAGFPATLAGQGSPISLQSELHKHDFIRAAADRTPAAHHDRHGYRGCPHIAHAAQYCRQASVTSRPQAARLELGHGGQLSHVLAGEHICSVAWITPSAPIKASISVCSSGQDGSE